MQALAHPVIVAPRLPLAGGTTDPGPADAFAEPVLLPRRAEIRGVALEQSHRDQKNRHQGYQTRQAFSRIIGAGGLQPNAFANCGELLTTPFTRNSPGECGSVWASCRELASVEF